MINETIKVPRNQIIQEILRDENNSLLQVVTSDELRRKFHLYNVEKDGALTKVESGDSPKFEKKAF